MRTLTLAALLLVVLSACGTESGDTAADPAGRPPMPATIPAAPGEVSTRGIVTILDDGAGPELCLGAVAESWPPQCGGPPVLGWDWKQQRMVPGQPGGAGGRGAFEQQSGVRWGQYALAGRWDGTSFTVTAAVPGALYDAAPVEPAPSPSGPAPDLSDAELQQVADDLGELPGALSSYVEGGRAQVFVVYDDGSLQAWADDRHGGGVAVVTSALVDVP